MYNPAALKAGIEKCKENIKTFEEAIQRERDTINEYYELIEKVQEKERIKEDQASRVHLEITSAH
jgi:ribosomal protein S20